jgi:glutaminase
VPDITPEELREFLRVRRRKAKQAAYRREYRQRPEVKMRRQVAKAAEVVSALRNRQIVAALKSMGVLEQFIGKNVDINA